MSCTRKIEEGTGSCGICGNCALAAAGTAAATSTVRAEVRMRRIVFLRIRESGHDVPMTLAPACYGSDRTCLKWPK